MVKYAPRANSGNTGFRGKGVAKRYSTGNKQNVNTAVKRVYKKTVPKTAPKKNMMAINTLAKQVRNLQLSKYGRAQWQHQHMVFTADNTLTNMTLKQVSPRAFCVNNFYTDSKIYTGTVAGTAPNQVASYATTANFTTVGVDSLFSNVYDWNYKQSQDTLSNVSYLPIKTNIKIRFRCVDNGPSAIPVRCRVTLFKFKTGSFNNTVQSHLPTNLGAYSYMVDRNPTTRNYFNTHEYHEILCDKYVYFKQQNAAQTDVERTLMIPLQFPGKKPLDVDIAASTPGSTDFTDNISKKDQIWCLISTDATTDSRVDFQMERWVHWRDQHGVGS